MVLGAALARHVWYAQRMYSIGIDQSPNHTGVCVLTKEGGVALLELIEPRTLTGVRRLAYVRDRLVEILAPLRKAKAAVGVWEFYALKATNKKFLQGELGCLAQLALYDHAKRVESCAPVALKKFITGDHEASKAKMMSTIGDRWGLKFSDDNLADAYGLARVGLALLDSTGTTQRAELEVLARIRNGPAKKTPKFRMRGGRL